MIFNICLMNALMIQLLDRQMHAYSLEKTAQVLILISLLCTIVGLIVTCG
jgi:hypothetical protein